MSPSGTRVVGYLRVSTEEQEDSGLGLAAQRSAIEAEAAHKGWILVTIIEDAESGRSMKNRKGLEAAMALIEAGMAEVLLVSKLDRLSRSTADFANTLDRATKNDWKIVAIDMGLDMTTPNGEMVASILMSIAQWERRTIGQRTKDALAVKKSNGQHLGRPSGLPERVVTRIARERAEGASLRTIATNLNADAIPASRGGTEWHASSVRAVLNRS